MFFYDFHKSSGLLPLATSREGEGDSVDAAGLPLGEVLLEFG